MERCLTLFTVIFLVTVSFAEGPKKGKNLSRVTLKDLAIGRRKIVVERNGRSIASVKEFNPYQNSNKYYFGAACEGRRGILIFPGDQNYGSCINNEYGHDYSPYEHSSKYFLFGIRF